MPVTQAPRATQVQVVLAAAAATADASVYVRAPRSGTVQAAYYVPVSAITGAASPASRTFNVINKGQAAAGTTVAATLAMVSGVDAAALVSKAIPVSTTAANVVVAAGDILQIQSLHIGATGLADPGGTFVLEFGPEAAAA